MTKLARYLEHTLLKPEATVDDIINLCTEAKEHSLGGVCVNPCYVALARHLLAGTGVKVVTVAGFPLGATFAEVKELEARMAAENHADEIDMVMNLAAFKTGDYQAVEAEIRRVVAAGAPCAVKVIIEACLLSDEEKIKACRLIIAAGAKFVKTSTGFAKSGATASDVRLLKKECAGTGVGVKAAGGIRDAAAVREMLEAGADRIGTSAGARIAMEDV
ncbi:MAG: deoxyribose-phosphate aldolase [Acidaminococcaceae bacterium]|jgi:deoxyribose-phosphate aldolase|nr:deoxyribose-phosphate aldolase [Acidaminococcaceae bacterium]